MSTINQKLKNKYKKKNFCWSPALKKKPQIRGRLIRVLITTPRKPNSALRKVGKVFLSAKKRILAKIAGSGTHPQKYAALLIRGKGCKDTPSVRYTIVRGALECLPLFNRKLRRSVYGSPNSQKIYVRRIERR